MTMRRHEIPTHLSVEDKAFYGLSIRQATYLMAAVSGAYWLWNRWPELWLGLRAVPVFACLAVGAALALLRPHGRGLEEWLFVALRYIAVSKAAVWRPRQLTRPSRRRASGRWEEMAPRVTWREDRRWVA
jgi:hypothetical protein